MSKSSLKWAPAAIGIWLFIFGSAALANHELGAPPDVHVIESDRIATVSINTQCPFHYIEYETSDYTAEAGKDYTSVSGRLTNPPWRFEVPILQDSIREPDEFIRVQIQGGIEAPAGSGGGSCGLGVNSYVIGKITIYDDDLVAEPAAGIVESPTTTSTRGGNGAKAATQGGREASEVQAEAAAVKQVDGPGAAGSANSKSGKPQSELSTLRFLVTAGILVLGVGVLFLFSSRRTLTTSTGDLRT